MHRALYRTYRPSTFSLVVGQDHITSVLRYQVRTGKTSHAYLFCGSRGTGKTSCAKILAKAVNCLEPADGEPCGKCMNCRAIDSGATPDVLEMDAASNTGVDYIRDIRDAVAYAPSMLKSRVYIIDEVHMLTDSAFNALLKTLEEPPSNVLFILATTEMQKIPATILSRCQRFEFRRIAAGVIAERLKSIAESEGVELENDAAYLIARSAQGGMRDAISLLELCMSDGGKVTSEKVERLSGGVGRKRLEETVAAIADKDLKKLFEIVADLYASAGDLSYFWQELIGFYRDMTVYKTVKMPPEELRQDILDLTEGEYKTLSTLADRFTYETLLYQMSVLDAAYPQTSGKSGVSGRISAETALIRMTDSRLSSTTDALIARISKLEQSMMYGFEAKPPRSDEPAADKAEPAPERKQTDQTAESDHKTPEETQIFPDFDEICHIYSKNEMSTARFLAGANAELKGTVLEVTVKDRISFEMLTRNHADVKLERIISSERGVNVKVVFKIVKVGAPTDLEDLD